MPHFLLALALMAGAPALAAPPGPADATPADPSADGPAGADGLDADPGGETLPDAAEGPAIDALRKRLMGRWALQPEGEKGRQVELLRLLAREQAPSDAQVAALGFEGPALEQALKARDQVKGDPDARAEVKRALAMVDGFTLEVKADVLEATDTTRPEAERAPQRVRWVPLAAEGDSLVIAIQPIEGGRVRRNRMELTEDGRLRVHENGVVRVSLVRRDR